MPKEDWILVLVFLVIGLLFIGLVFVFFTFRGKEAKEVSIKARLSAKELLEFLNTKENDLQKLQEYSEIAKSYYLEYLEEYSDFDVEFVVGLSSHKAVNAKLVLEVERYFKKINPAREKLIEKALVKGLDRR
ncbi:hypothetical protein B6S12_09395 [Helicobacter valdiviensis]|uniref:Uncharacterized protein n=1 Tax=Helicobacter valdiviensis TaxID=1458358 RepID=A0A2W6MS45_9HELI|nr:hypothetical protein [Helicobacter valdiviensis]PZT47375.1 hypothetical protein B6S12_09395 [Helicobacter valdiviensis]